MWKPAGSGVLADTSHITTLPESPMIITCKDVSLSWRNGLPAMGILCTSPSVRLILGNVQIKSVLDPSCSNP
ncbi:MAG: hypothetical protein ACLU9S_21160 [Oscillospiraceae bacterium]|nr:hypothetical protein [Bacillota bacterium]